MRAKARRCPMPGCGVKLTDVPHLPNSKELDRIVPGHLGGTYTHGNVRIICRRCNQLRPKDGSDYLGPVTLWAQGPLPVTRADGRRNGALCRKGLHPWVPENILIVDSRPGGKRLCRACYQATNNNRLRRCQCGSPLGTGGRTFTCPSCTRLNAIYAATLHAGGLAWPQVAAQVGYTTAEGARFAAKRIGYAPASRPKRNVNAKHIDAPLTPRFWWTSVIPMPANYNKRAV